MISFFNNDGNLIWCGMIGEKPTAAFLKEELKNCVMCDANGKELQACMDMFLNIKPNGFAFTYSGDMARMILVNWK